MSNINENSFDDFQFDEDIFVDSIHLEELRKRTHHQKPAETTKKPVVTQNTNSDEKFSRHKSHNEPEKAFTPCPSELEDDFSDGSDLFRSDWDDNEIQKNNTPLKADSGKASTPYPDELEDDFSDGSDLFRSDWDDNEIQKNNTPLKADSGKASTPCPDELEDDFSDSSGLFGSDWDDNEIQKKTPVKTEQSSAKIWVLIAVLMVGFLAIFIIQLTLPKDSLHSAPENNYPEPGSASELNSFTSSAESVTEENPSSDTTETSETESSSSEYVTLKLGDKSEDVKNMQLRLKKLGYLNEKACTGYYGSVTERIVKFFQQKAGLKATGIADSETLKVLFSDDAPTCY